jgi:hypothetical protein
MRYQVPQFIEIEDKIFGPFTLKQFIYLAGGGGICLIFFTLLPLIIAIALAVPVIALALALAFFQVNGRPFIVAMEHAFGYVLGTKLYLWKQRAAEAPKQRITAANIPNQPQMPVPKLSESKLKDLAWSLNIKDKSATSSAQERTGFEI